MPSHPPARLVGQAAGRASGAYTSVRRHVAVQEHVLCDRLGSNTTQELRTRAAPPMSNDGGRSRMKDNPCV